MKRRTFYQLSLSLPYILLIVTGAFTYFADGLNVFNDVPDSGLSIITGMMVFYTIAGIVWGPLYTWMVVVMLLWGRGRSTEEIRRLYLLSPVLLACSMGIPVLITDPASSGRFFLEGILRMNNMGFAVPAIIVQGYEESSSVIGFAWLFMAAISILVGYIFVGIAMWLERVLTKRGKFKEETDILPTTTS
ncbi:MAG: hypothetical protein QM730_08435 [Anaerolineales bacterium]